MTGVWIILGLVVAFSAVVARSWSNTARRNLWHNAALRLGLHQYATRLQMAGRIDGFAVNVRASGRRGVQITVIGRQIPFRLRIEAESMSTRVQQVFTGADIQTHDASFDDLVLLHGEEPQVVALMSWGTRRLLRDVMLGGGNTAVAGARVTHHSTKRFSGPEDLVLRVRSLVALARALSHPPQKTPDLLLTSAGQDPNQKVQLRNLEVLLSSFPDTPQTRQATETALRGSNPHTRLRAAVLKQDAAVLGELANHAPEEVRSSALLHLAPPYPRDRIIDAALAALCGGRELRKAAVSTLGRTPDDRAVQPLIDLLARSSGQEAEEITRTLGHLRDPRAEACLVRLLGVADPAVQIAAANALGGLGSVRAVEHLLPLTKGVLVPAKLAIAAGDALRQIRGRIGDVDEGRLTVVEDARHGELSLTAAVAGQLTLPEKAKMSE